MKAPVEGKARTRKPRDASPAAVELRAVDTGALAPDFRAAWAGSASALDKINPITMVFTMISPGRVYRPCRRSGGTGSSKVVAPI